MNGNILTLRRTAVERLWRVRDSLTGLEILRGTREECVAYVAAFGLCYAEEVG